jgi:hypothetical protein
MVQSVNVSRPELIGNSLEPNSMIGRSERVQIRQFIEKSWKELMLLESEKQKEHSKVKISSKFSHSKKVAPLSPNKMSLTTSKIDHKGSPSVAQISRREIDEESDSEPKAVSARNNLFLTQTNIFDLKKQIKARVEGTMQVQEALKEAQDARKKKEEKKKMEWEHLKDKLEKFNQKCNK